MKISIWLYFNTQTLIKYASRVMITISLISHCTPLKIQITPILRSPVCYINSFSLDIGSSAHWIRSHFYRDACLQMVGESSCVNTFPFQPAQGYCGGMVSYGAREVGGNLVIDFFLCRCSPGPPDLGN